MRILDSDKYINEKLNIKPITRERLSKFKKRKPSKDYAFDFKTGDIACIGASSRDVKPFVYISYYDIIARTYDDMLDFFPPLSSWDFCVDGAFILYENKKFKMDMLASFNENLSMDDITYQIIYVYRVSGLTLPLDKSYFTHPPIDVADLVWDSNRS